DPDALLGHLLRQPDRERVEPGLRGGIVDVLAPAAQPAGPRGAGHDPPPPRGPPGGGDTPRTASPAERNGPTRFTVNMRCSRSTVSSSTRARWSTIPALLTRTVTGPRAAAASNRAVTAPWEVRSPATEV